MKKALVMAMLATLLVSALFATGCGDGGASFSFTTAKLSEATLALGVTDDYLPVEPTTRFTSETPEIHCSVKLSNAPSKTEVKSVWVYVGGEVEGLSDYEIDSFSVITDGTRYLNFSMPRPDNGFPQGDYKLVLYVDDKEVESLPFTILAVRGELGETYSYTMYMSYDDLSITLDYWQKGTYSLVSVDVLSPEEETSLSVYYDGRHAYVYSPDDNLAFKSEIGTEMADFSEQTSMFAELYVKGQTDDDVLAELQDYCRRESGCSGVTLFGHDTMYGVSSTIFEVTSQDGTVSRLWLDLKTGAPIRLESMDDDKLVLLEWNNINIGGDIPDTMFELPADAIIIE